MSTASGGNISFAFVPVTHICLLASALLVALVPAAVLYAKRKPVPSAQRHSSIFSCCRTRRHHRSEIELASHGGVVSRTEYDPFFVADVPRSTTLPILCYAGSSHWVFPFFSAFLATAGVLLILMVILLREFWRPASSGSSPAVSPGLPVAVEVVGIVAGISLVLMGTVSFRTFPLIHNLAALAHISLSALVQALIAAVTGQLRAAAAASPTGADPLGRSHADLTGLLQWRVASVAVSVGCLALIGPCYAVERARAAETRRRRAAARAASRGTQAATRDTQSAARETQQQRLGGATGASASCMSSSLTSASFDAIKAVSALDVSASVLPDAPHAAAPYTGVPYAGVPNAGAPDAEASQVGAREASFVPGVLLGTGPLLTPGASPALGSSLGPVQPMGLAGQPLGPAQPSMGSGPWFGQSPALGLLPPLDEQAPGGPEGVTLGEQDCEEKSEQKGGQQEEERGRTEASNTAFAGQDNHHSASQARVSPVTVAAAAAATPAADTSLVETSFTESSAPCGVPDGASGGGLSLLGGYSVAGGRWSGGHLNSSLNSGQLSIAGAPAFPAGLSTDTSGYGAAGHLVPTGLAGVPDPAESLSYDALPTSTLAGASSGAAGSNSSNSNGGGYLGVRGPTPGSHMGTGLNRSRLRWVGPSSSATGSYARSRPSSASLSLATATPSRSATTTTSGLAASAVCSGSGGSSGSSHVSHGGQPRRLSACQRLLCVRLTVERGWRVHLSLWALSQYVALVGAGVYYASLIGDFSHMRLA